MWHLVLIEFPVWEKDVLGIVQGALLAELAAYEGWASSGELIMLPLTAYAPLLSHKSLGGEWRRWTRVLQGVAHFGTICQQNKFGEGRVFHWPFNLRSAMLCNVFYPVSNRRMWFNGDCWRIVSCKYALYTFVRLVNSDNMQIWSIHYFLFCLLFSTKRPLGLCWQVYINKPYKFIESTLRLNSHYTYLHNLLWGINLSLEVI